MGKHPSKTVIWQLKNLRNWIYDKWMRRRGYKPYGFNFKENKYIYMSQSEIDEIECNEDEPVHEVVEYDGPRNVISGLSWRYEMPAEVKETLRNSAEE